jgi:hypothetical protein
MVGNIHYPLFAYQYSVASIERCFLEWLVANSVAVAIQMKD